MTDHLSPDPTPTVAEEMVRELGIAPALAEHEATDKLVDSIRAQTDEVAVRAQAAVDEQREEAHEQSLRQGPVAWGTGHGSSDAPSPASEQTA